MSGVGGKVDSQTVRDTIFKNVRAVWGSMTCSNAWVEMKMSRYVRIDGILEDDWVKGGWEKLKEENDGTLWGHRLPVVVERAWKKVSIKAEVRTAAGAYDLVRSGVR